MEIVTREELISWLKLDNDADQATLDMLTSSALDMIEAETSLVLRPYVDVVTGQTVTPLVPQSLKHAIAVFVHAHYDNRTGTPDLATATVRNLCRPFRVMHL